MIIIPRHDPLLLPKGYTYARSYGGFEYETVPWVRVDNLWLRGDYTVDTPEGYRELKSLRIGEYVNFYPEPVRGYGKGFLVKSGDLSRAMSPSEAWSLAAGWLTSPDHPFRELYGMTERKPEAETLLAGEGTFISGGLSALYGALSKFDTYQLQALLRGAVWAISTWDNGNFTKFSTLTKRALMTRLVGPFGRFATNMGLVFTQGWRKRFIPEAISSLESRINPDKYTPAAHDVFPLKVRQIWKTKIRITRIVEGTNARVLGLRIKGLTHEPPLL